MPRKTQQGWKVDLRPNGRDGPRFRKTFPTQGEALAYEKYILANNHNPEPWQSNKSDKRRLSILAKAWFDLHGHQLKSGNKRMVELNHVIELMGDPVADKFTAKDYTAFRAERLKDVSPNTVNHELAYLRALFNELRRLGDWPKPNPLADVRRVKMDDYELAFLELDQARELLAVLDESPTSHARISARLALATGGRWGEVSTVKLRQIAKGRITYAKTKNGKSRTIPIAPELEKLVREHAPLVDGLNTFKRAIVKLGWDLPKGQSTHILRHTFASHFMMNGGNILTLQRILGHGNITMTMRYAHLSPDHLSEALDFNPLKAIG